MRIFVTGIRKPESADGAPVAACRVPVRFAFIGLAGIGHGFHVVGAFRSQRRLQRVGAPSSRARIDAERRACAEERSGPMR